MKRALLTAGWLAMAVTNVQADTGWSQYGGDQGGQRHSAATQITPANVTGLRQVWSYSTGAMTRHADAMKRASFEDTPILAEGRLYVCSQFNEVSALDPGSGKELWRFDPKLNTAMHYPNDYICRGVVFWREANASANATCAARIFLNTADRRLIALDAKTGKPCADFGKRGTVVIGEGPQIESKGLTSLRDQ